MLFRSGAVQAPQLNGKDFYLTYEDCCFTAEFRERMREAGVHPRHEKFFGAVSTNLDCVLNKGGYTLLPETAAMQILKEKEGFAAAFLWGKPFYTWGQILVNNDKYLTRPMQELIHKSKNQVDAMMRVKA